MNQKNFIDISKNFKKRFIYRIIPLKHLYEIFESKKNILVKPKKWDDPFENFILQSTVQLSTGDLSSLQARDQFYGQCWTLQSSSDAMWRIYSKNKKSVRIRTTIQDLADSLAKSLGALSYLEAYIGKVKYLSSNRLMQYAKRAYKTPTDPYFRMFAETLLIKRPAFRHEREIRLLFFSSDTNNQNEDIHSYEIDPHSLISQIMIDPRLSQKAANELREKIKEKTKFTGPIKHSLESPLVF